RVRPGWPGINPIAQNIYLGSGQSRDITLLRRHENFFILPAIVPHNAKASALIRYVSGEDEEIFMPPKKSDVTRLTAVEINILRDWIDAGPSWPDALAGKAETTTYWSLRPLVKPAVPSNQGNLIDAFIQAKLEKTAPSPEAE